MTAVAHNLKFHEAANIFPLMEEHELDELGKDIAENGLQVPIQTYDGLIIDGRNRYKACLIHCPDQIQCEDVTIDVGDPIKYVVSLNLHRRHLDESQRSMVASKLATLKNGEAGRGRKIGPQNCGPITTKQAAEMLSVSTRSVEAAKHVIAKATPEVAKAVERGSMKVSTAAKVADLPKPVQKKAVEAASRGGNKGAVEVVKEHLTREGISTDSVGIKYAHKAIGQLMRIPPTDKLRARGFEIVTKWIADNQ